MHLGTDGPLQYVVEIRFTDKAHPDNLRRIVSILRQYAQANNSVIGPKVDIRETGMRFVVQLKQRRTLELTDPLEGS